MNLTNKVCTIVEATNGFAVIVEDWNGNQSVAHVCHQRADLANYFDATDRPRVGLDQMAEAIVACNSGTNIRKIAMIKAIRSATNCGLKEGKEAIERALERMPVID